MTNICIGLLVGFVVVSLVGILILCRWLDEYNKWLGLD